MQARQWPLIVGLALAGSFICSGYSAQSSAADQSSAAEQTVAQQAQQLLEQAGVLGGLVVHLGCGDGQLTAALRSSESFLVHGLDTQPANVEAARKHVRSLGLYGKVAVDIFDGKRLPYIDNCVNLLVVDQPGAIDRAELLRVLCPNGVALIKDGQTWTKTVKPRPAELDQWTHYLYDPTNNAVSRDRAVDFPRHLQWLAGPRWSRHHDHMSSASAMVSAEGRNFYIFDEGSTASILLSSNFQLIARDAFSGVLLWKRPIPKWHTQMWRLKSGPASLPRRLVAVGQRVYVTLGLDAPVSQLDAATGKTLRTYQQTVNTEELLVDGRMLLVVIDDSPLVQPPLPKNFIYDFSESPRRVLAVDTESGETLWEHKARWVTPLSLTADGRRVLFYDGQSVVCLQQATGAELWQTPLGRRTSVPSYYGPTLVSHQGVILFAGSDPESTEYHTDNAKTLFALDAATGRRLWTAEHPMSGYRSPEDILVIDGLVWTAPLFLGSHSGIFTGRELRTGEVKVEFPPDVNTHWFHHRCYRAKATERYILTSRTGIEFVDIRAKHWTCHHWVRGACLYGIMPANGMIYNMPHPCACYLEAKLFGFNALAPASPTRKVPDVVPDEDRLQRGPAYDDLALAAGTAPAPGSAPSDWPMYRRDPARSGHNPMPVPAELKQSWQAEIGGRLSSVVIADGKLLVAAVDSHTVHALDAESGRPLWAFTAGGRIDSPPTVWRGRVLFGSADGYVYCLRATDGALCWRFRAAPIDRRMVAFDQVESVWPVHGSVLIHDGVLWCAAGRSMFLDGGIRLLRLDPVTGKKLGEEVFDDRDPDSGENLQVRLRGLNMPVALPDILVAHQDKVFMKSLAFDRNGKRLNIDAPTQPVAQQQGEDAHLFCPTGFLDDAYWHRSYWVYGLRWASGAGGYYLAGRFAPSGRLLVFDAQRVYGFNRKPQYFRWTTPIEHHLFASDKQPPIERTPRKPPPETEPKPVKKPAAKSGTKADAQGPAEPPKQAASQPAAKTEGQQQPHVKSQAQQKPAPKAKFSASESPDARIICQWTQPLPLLARALVLAGDRLFVAGPPDLVDEEEALRTFDNPETQQKLLQQQRAWEGALGMILWVAAADDGRKLAEYRLPGLPVFDGMAAAGGKLYLATTEGKILCFTGK